MQLYGWEEKVPEVMNLLWSHFRQACRYIGRSDNQQKRQARIPTLDGKDESAPD
jgi:hypothetical protein